MSFLQRLKNRGVRSGQTSLQSDSEETAVDKVAQLHVDVYQTERMIVIYILSFLKSVTKELILHKNVPGAIFTAASFCQKV